MLNIREGVISDFVHGDITTWGWPGFTTNHWLILGGFNPMKVTGDHEKMP
jgi:hypothetical protein